MVTRLRAARRCDTKIPFPDRLMRKVVLTAHFARDPSATLTMGNHGVILGRQPLSSPPMPHVDLPERLVEVCHVPVRSARQFVIKTAVKRMARVAAGRDYVQGTSMHVALDAIRRGVTLSPVEMLSTHLDVDGPAFAAAWARPEAGDDCFLNDIALRYTESGSVDPVPVVLSAVERLVSRLVDVRASAGEPGRMGAAA